MGGAARFRTELLSYLERTGRTDVRVIGASRRLGPGWLAGREVAATGAARRVALNNVGFFAPGGPRWTLLANALHFLSDTEIGNLHPSLLPVARRQAPVVRLAAARSDVLIAPCTAMADRIAASMPSVQDRLIVRMHPISAQPLLPPAEGTLILCPIIFEEYKHMPAWLLEWLAAVDAHLCDARMIVTANRAEVPADLSDHPRIKLIGRQTCDDLLRLWGRSRAVFFPTGLESFGFPLAEARAYGRPVIARDTPQNKEIAGPALCGFSPDDRPSLLRATRDALTIDIKSDPAPFEPHSYFDWMLGRPT